MITKLLLLQVFCFMLMPLWAQGIPGTNNHPSNSYDSLFNKIYTDSGIRIYYDKEILPQVEVEGSFKKATLFEDLSVSLASHELSIIKYTSRQWVIVPSKELNVSAGAWRKQKLLDYLIESTQADSTNNIIVIGDANDPGEGNTVRIKGIVTEAEGGRSVIGVTISTPDLREGAATDDDGRYSLRLPRGENILQINALGFEPITSRLIVRGPGTYDIVLQTNSVELGEVVVRENIPDQNVRSAQMGIERIQMAEIKKLPSFMGEVDVMNSLSSLPGVSNSGEGVGGIHVRGGNVDQNLILQDDIIYFNPTHALGFFSLFSSFLSQ